MFRRCHASPSASFPMVGWQVRDDGWPWHAAYVVWVLAIRRCWWLGGRIGFYRGAVCRMTLSDTSGSHFGGLCLACWALLAALDVLSPLSLSRSGVQVFRVCHASFSASIPIVGGFGAAPLSCCLVRGAVLVRWGWPGVRPFSPLLWDTLWRFALALERRLSGRCARARACALASCPGCVRSVPDGSLAVLSSWYSAARRVRSSFSNKKCVCVCVCV